MFESLNCCSVFWPAGVFFSQAGIMVSYCLVGCGCAIIESATSAYCLLAGPPKYATSRLLVMQCAQALGSTIAASVGNCVFQRGVELPEEKLDQINLSYLVSQTSKQKRNIWGLQIRFYTRENISQLNVNDYYRYSACSHSVWPSGSKSQDCQNRLRRNWRNMLA